MWAISFGVARITPTAGVFVMYKYAPSGRFWPEGDIRRAWSIISATDPKQTVAAKARMGQR